MITRIRVLPMLAQAGMLMVPLTVPFATGELYTSSPVVVKSPSWSRSIHTVKYSS